LDETRDVMVLVKRSCLLFMLLLAPASGLPAAAAAVRFEPRLVGSWLIDAQAIESAPPADVVARKKSKRTKHHHHAASVVVPASADHSRSV
jgi:hypothetical protein